MGIAVRLFILGLSWICWWGLSFPAAAQVEDIVVAKDLQKNPAQFEYHPVDKDFWSDFQNYVQQKKFSKALSFTVDRLKKFREESVEKTEVLLAQAIAVYESSLPFAASRAFEKIVIERPASHQANQALIYLQEIAKKWPIDQDDVFREVVLDQEYGVPPVEIQDFLAYQNGAYNFARGYISWSEMDFKKISIGSYWDYKLKYFYALQEVQRGRIDSAIEKFASLAGAETTPADIRAEAQHQYGRLVFEKGDYELSYKLFKTVELNPRERGLLLLERAWSRYYTKNYSKALGLLAALEAPIFDPARTGEPYILKMLIYKELCYYDAALNVKKEFESRFSTTLARIYRRRDLRTDPWLVQMSAADRRVSFRVDLLAQIKEELQSETLKNKQMKDLRIQLDAKKRELYAQLNGILLDKTRAAADAIVDWQDQISFLDYQTRIDALRVTRAQAELDYKTEEVPHMSFDRVYWIFKGEFWLDELENLKVQVDSQCTKESRR